MCPIFENAKASSLEVKSSLAITIAKKVSFQMM